MPGQHSQLETINSLYLGTSKASGQDMMSPISAHDPPYKYFQNTSPPGHSHHLGLNASPHGFSPELLTQPPPQACCAKLMPPPPSPDECHNVLFIKAPGATPTQGSEKWMCQGFSLLVCPDTLWVPCGWIHIQVLPPAGERRRGEEYRGSVENRPFTWVPPEAHIWP